MKMVSPKTLLASLLGIAFIVIKIVTFDGVGDLAWIGLMAYWTINGLIVAFSQEAYDEDVKKAYQGKALYRDLFGKFAFIAADIPMILIFLSAFLLVVFPAEEVIMAVCVIMLLALVYAVWFCLYVSGQKRKRMENGQWGTAVLSGEDERAWKSSERWHNVCYGMIAVLGILYLMFGDAGFI